MTNIPLSGVLTSEGHVLTQRVYYEDTDFSGVVYHARYLHFMERGRTDFLRLLGVEQAKLHAAEGDGVVFVVHRMEIDFKGSARMDDVLTIVTKSEQAGGAKLVLAQQVRSGDRVLIAAKVTVAVINRSGRPRRLPADLAARFA
ncbi:tol-pal system-associated acyl-CoA thioesterase [Rhizobium sp.]